MKQQMSYANAAGIPVAVIVGENEIKAGQVSIKDLNAGKEQAPGSTIARSTSKRGRPGR